MIESRERAAQKALESCTFTPILKKNPRLLHKYEDIIEKTRKNQQKKQESLRKPSSEARKLAEELKHCTFKPEISRFRRSSRDFDEKSDKTLRKDALSSKKRSFSSKTNSFSAKSLAKVENSSVSVRNSEEKARFRKANEQFLRKRSSERLFFEDFRKETRETPKNSKKNDKKAARNSHNFEEIPGFSKEIGETLEIFQRIRAHIQKPIEKPAQVQVRENPAKLAKIQRKSSIYNNLRNSSKLSENKENIKKLSQKPFKAKETRGKTVRNSGISHKNNGFSQSCQASTQKPANLSGKYATLLRKAEEITEHLNGVLFAKS
ncbi:MAG: hypothetical protein H6620_12225 [Halobacteriovoraceae bacterium]|nr:hypothetical protein [Halobacteriovoraceae bacterium]